MNLSEKKRLAARVLGVGVGRVRLNPDKLEAIEDAITRSTIRGLVKDGVIWVEQAKGISRGRARARRKTLRKRGRGRGSKEGSEGARIDKKTRWILHVRALRKELNALKEKGEITRETFNNFYRQIRGGQVRSVKHLKQLASKTGRGG